MKLATLNNGTRDGELIVVSRDLTRATSASALVATMQGALEQWTDIAPQLDELAAALESGSAADFSFDPKRALAPLPRAWQWLDGSAFDSHGDLMQKVFGLAPLPRDRPLMYQGMSDHFLAPTEDVPMPSEDDSIDFEGEFGVITDAVPMGISAEDATAHIRLVVLLNDWSLRRLAPIEMKTGFGWVHAKPACSVAPVAVTPDDLGSAWRDGRVDLPLNVWWNDELFGSANGYAMSVGLHDLVAHAAYSRNLVAGTIIGTGTVSNENYREIGSSCIAERRGIELLDLGESHTPFMSFGDRVRMEASLEDGTSVFGAIDQKVVKA
jgi:fumarylacetoacetate (FAA) hydrolase